MPKNKPKDTAEDATPAPKKRNKKRHAGPSALVTNSMGTSAKATAQNNKKRRKSATVKGLDQSSLYNEVAAEADEVEESSPLCRRPTRGGGGGAPRQETSTIANCNDSSSRNNGDNTNNSNSSNNKDSSPNLHEQENNEAVDALQQQPPPPLFPVHQNTASAAQVSTILCDRRSSTLLPRGDNLQRIRNMDIIDTKEWLDYCPRFTIQEGVWIKKGGIYGARMGGYLKAGFIFYMNLINRVSKLFPGLSPTTVRFIATHDAIPRRNLGRLETFVKFCLFCQKRTLENGEDGSWYTGDGEVYVDDDPDISDKIYDITELYASSQKDFTLEVVPNNMEPITRESWTSHPLIKKFLYTAALGSTNRHTHPDCEFAVGDVNGEGRAFHNLWKRFAYDFHATCPCMDAATSTTWELFRELDEEYEKLDEVDEIDEVDYNEYKEEVGGFDGDEYEEECGGGNGGGSEEEDKQDVEGSLIPGIGIHNPGYLCYINAILQVLFTFPEFIEDLCIEFHKKYSPVKKMPLIKALLEIAVTIGVINEKNAPRISIRRTRGVAKGASPLGLKHQMDLVTEQFHGKGQQDVHEFFGWLINMVRYELADISNDEQEDEAEMPLDDDNESTAAERDDNTDAAGSTILPSDNFRMKVRETLQCTECGYSRRSDELYHDL